MKYLKNIAVLSLSFLLFNCSISTESEKNNFPTISDGDFEIVEELTSTVVDSSENYLIGAGPTTIVDNKIFILDRKSEGPIHIVDLETDNYVGNFGVRGKGPGEIAVAWNISRIDDENILLLDVAQKKIQTYRIDSLISGSKAVTERRINPASYTAHPVYDNQKVFFLDNSNADHRIYYTDYTNENAEISGLGDIPTLTSEDEPKNIRGEAEQAILKKHNNYMVVGYKLTPRIDIYNIANDTWISFSSPDDFTPIYKTSSEDSFAYFGITDETVGAFGDIALTDEHIYALYSGRKLLDDRVTKGNEIYVFDYEGNPVKKLMLDKDISFFDISNENKLYAISVDILSQLLKFDLNNI